MSKRLKIEAIVPAAGQGLRLKSSISKPLILLDNSPIIIHTLKILDRHPEISKITVLSNKKDLEKVQRLITLYKIHKVKCVERGGATRRESVERGLKFLDRDTDFVLIHDGVRPFVTKEIVSRCILKARNCGASIVGIPLKPTIKKIRGGQIREGRKSNFFVDKTLDRGCLWEVQTPQVFRKEALERAYKKFKNEDAPDDACLVEKSGNKVAVVEGSYFNIKITTPEDLVFAEAILKIMKLRKVS